MIDEIDCVMMDIDFIKNEYKVNRREAIEILKIILLKDIVKKL